MPLGLPRADEWPGVCENGGRPAEPRSHRPLDARSRAAVTPAGDASEVAFLRRTICIGVAVSTPSEKPRADFVRSSAAMSSTARGGRAA